MNGQHPRMVAGGSGIGSPRSSTSTPGFLRDGEFWVGVGVIALGMFFFLDSFNIEVQPSYATIGPRFFPVTVGLSLIGCGVWTVLARLRSLPARSMGEPSASIPELAALEGTGAFQWKAFLTAVAGLVAYISLLTRLGFVLSSAVLFAAAAHSLGSHRLVPNLLIGLVFAAMIYVAFSFGLGLYLPEPLVDSFLR